jgi:hypothetical protein
MIGKFRFETWEYMLVHFLYMLGHDGSFCPTEARQNWEHGVYPLTAAEEIYYESIE